MHGLGNDFILLNNLNPSDYDLGKLAVKLCHRQLGIGADGIVLVLPSDKADIRMRIVNSDGSEPNMCGNAIRCFAKYVYENKIITKKQFSIETFAGVIIPELITDQGNVTEVSVNMGKPGLERNDIPMTGRPGFVINEPLPVGNETFFVTSMLMNIPHTMVFVDNIEEIDIVGIGRQIEKHPNFPKGTNVNFVQVINEKEVKMRTWERGAGYTLACGTGSCATGVAAFLNKKTGRKVIVHLALGDLTIEWKDDNNVYMTGPAETVFAGQINI
ncbi:MAG TPA: diaminopimelate epimerase [Bacteroidales bacterium]